MRQATFRATITDTTPAIIAALFTCAGDDPGHSTKVWPPGPPATDSSHPHQSRHQPRASTGIHSHPYATQNAARSGMSPPRAGLRVAGGGLGAGGEGDAAQDLAEAGAP